jgi:hypothetical protein
MSMSRAVPKDTTDQGSAREAHTDCGQYAQFNRPVTELFPGEGMDVCLLFSKPCTVSIVKRD